MKEIKINHYTEPDLTSVFTRDKFFRVCLGNGLIFTFSNRKNLESFFVRVNRELRLTLMELIKVYGELTSDYWLSWFYVQKGSDLDAGTQTIAIHLKNIPDLINLIVDRSHHINGNYFVFSHMYRIIDILNDACDIILDIRHQKVHYSEILDITVTKRRLQEIKEKLKVLGS